MNLQIKCTKCGLEKPATNEFFHRNSARATGFGSQCKACVAARGRHRRAHEVRLCSVEGCGRGAVSRGWCSTHYGRWRNHGDPLHDAVSYHGHTKKRRLSPTYGSWKAMKQRCLIPTRPDYDRYGGRGITVCERWLGKDGFANFLADMGERPEGMTLDRLNPDGPYEPENCQWSTQSEQERHKRVRIDHLLGRDWTFSTAASLTALRDQLRVALAEVEGALAVRGNGSKGASR